MPSSASPRNKEPLPSGEETWPMSSVISPPRLWTLPSKMSTNRSSCLELTRKPSSAAGSWLTWHPVVLLEPLLSASSTPWTSPVPGKHQSGLCPPSSYFISHYSVIAWELMLAEELLNVNSLAWVTAWPRPWNLMVFSVCTVDSACLSRVSSSTAPPTSVFTTLPAACCPTPRIPHWLSTGWLPSASPPSLELSHTPSTLSVVAWWCSLVVPSLKSCTRTHLTAGSKSLRLKEAVLSSRELCRTFSAELVVPLYSSSTMNSRLCLVKLTKLFVHRIRFSVGSKHLRPQKNTIKTHVR